MYFGVIFVNLKKHRLLNMIVFLYTNLNLNPIHLSLYKNTFSSVFVKDGNSFVSRCGKKTIRLEDVKKLQENKMCQKFRIIVRIYTLSLELSIVINFSNIRLDYLRLFIYYIVVLTIIFFSYKSAFIYELNKPH